MTEKTKHLGKESLKSSGKWFRNSQMPTGAAIVHKNGHGASAGDGRTSDKSILGKIIVVFRSGK